MSVAVHSARCVSCIDHQSWLYGRFVYISTHIHTHEQTNTDDDFDGGSVVRWLHMDGRAQNELIFNAARVESVCLCVMISNRADARAIIDLQIRMLLLEG